MIKKSRSNNSCKLELTKLIDFHQKHNVSLAGGKHHMPHAFQSVNQRGLIKIHAAVRAIHAN